MSTCGEGYTHREVPTPKTGLGHTTWFGGSRDTLNGGSNESMVSLVLRQYMRGENGTESLVGCFFQTL